MDRTPAPKTLLEAVTRFADPQVAHDFFVTMRFPNGVACPREGCGSADVAAIKNRNAWRCRECNRQFTVKVGTVFEDSPIGFDKWLPAMWLLSSNRNGVSSYEIARGIGVSQKTAWFMLHRLRLAMKADGADMLSGEVEADETYIGGSRQNKRGNIGSQNVGAPSKGPHEGKTTVMGIIERGGRVRAFTIPNVRRATVMPRIREHVLPGSTVYTDALKSYRDVAYQYRHEIIDHTIAYVEGKVHTNSIENFWSVLKRTLAGTYICARPFHLDAYLDEQVFRFNARTEKDGARFTQALKGADGRRVTWVQLTNSHRRWRAKPSGLARTSKSRRNARIQQDGLAIYGGFPPGE